MTTDWSERLSALYQTEVAGVSAQVSSALAIGERVMLTGTLVNNTDQQVIGYFGRTALLEQQRMRHTQLFINAHYRGRGIGQALSKHWEDGYRQLGLDSINLTAQWHGAALWPALGYQPDDLQEAHREIWQASRHVLDPRSGDWVNGRGELLITDLLRKGHISAELAETARRYQAEPRSLQELLVLGRDQSWRAANTAELWLGRMLLAGSSYEATKVL